MITSKDINELTELVNEMTNAVYKDPRRIDQAREVFNGAGKIASLMKVQCVYAALKGEEPEIAFMGKGSGKLLKPQAKMLGA
jgi:hypothetical protein